MNKQLLKLYFGTTKQLFKETKELITDIKQQGFGKIKISKLGREKVFVEASKGSQKFSCEMDAIKNKILQTTETNSYVLLPFLPYKHSINIAEGDLKGRLNKLKKINIRKDNIGNFRETTHIQDFQTGNSYKRIKTPQGTQYFKYIENTWQQLFRV